MVLSSFTWLVVSLVVLASVAEPVPPSLSQPEAPRDWFATRGEISRHWRERHPPAPQVGASEMDRNAFVLSNMDQILNCLTRGLDLSILSRGYGDEGRGVTVSFQAQTPILGAARAVAGLSLKLEIHCGRPPGKPGIITPAP